ncbi:MAG: hypothetical protein ACKVPX_15115 [Myxococcaceae bacterium]
MIRLLLVVTAVGCLFVSRPALAQVPELAPQQAVSAQTSQQRWEYKIIRAVDHVDFFGVTTTWFEDRQAVEALPAGWMDVRGAQGWELVTVANFYQQINASVYERTYIWYFKRPASN